MAVRNAGTHIPRCTRPARPIPLPPDVGAMKPCTPRGKPPYRRSAPLLARKFQILRHPIPKRPVGAGVLRQRDEYVLWASRRSLSDARGDPRIQRALRLLGPPGGEEHLHDHDVVRAIDAKVAGVVDDAAARVCRHDLEAVALRNA